MKSCEKQEFERADRLIKARLKTLYEDKQALEMALNTIYAMTENEEMIFELTMHYMRKMREFRLKGALLTAVRMILATKRELKNKLNEITEAIQTLEKLREKREG